MIRKPKPYHKWTSSDIKYLCDNFGKLSKGKIMKELNLDCKRISSRAYTLGLKRSEK